ncbi:MAG: hypothetical protein AUJ82_06590 [Verrucomicrobia bacterium CG1_02_43_26]|nr:MAG: hypothetical protein AUJ82_06590 [Verrucomicrobia bacterium CG1_02_43_26]
MLFFASGQSKLATHGIEIDYFDKIGHFLVFGLLATAFYRIPFFWNLKLIGLILVLFIVTLFGASDEIHQSFTPERNFEYTDMIADFSGAFIALLVYKFWHLYRAILEYPVFGSIKRYSPKKGYVRSFGDSDAPLTRP